MQLDKFDLKFCVQRLPKKLFDLMISDNWADKIFVGGGYIRAVIAQEKLSDVDLFVQTKEEGAMVAGLLADKPSDIHTSDNALTIRGKIPIQIITRWLYQKPEDVAASFDFTICSAIIFYRQKKWDSHCNVRFYTDLAAKRLVYQHPVRNEDAGGSILRVLKYYQRGYRIPLDSLSGVIARLMSAVEVDRIDGGLKDQFAVSKVVCGLLREVDPNIDIEHQVHLPAAAGLEIDEVQ